MSSAAAASAVRPRVLASANDTVRVACIGFNNFGRTHIASYLGLPNVEIAALCDIDGSVMARGLKMVEAAGRKRPATYTDYRKLLDDKSIDVVDLVVPNALHLPIERFEPVIQDVEIPMGKASEFLEFYFREINIRPCWVCPIRPLEAARNWTLFAMEPGALYLNFGFWGSVRTCPDAITGYFNRRIESIVQKLGGRKSLYSTSFFTEDEFRRIYNGDAYKKLKEKFDPRGAFQGLYQKAVLGQ